VNLCAVGRRHGDGGGDDVSVMTVFNVDVAVDVDDVDLLRRRRHDERRFLVVVFVQNDDVIAEFLDVGRRRTLDRQVPVAVVAVVGLVGVAVALRVGVGRMRQFPFPESIDLASMLLKVYFRRHLRNG